MKNQLASELMRAKRSGEADGIKEGYDFALMLVAVALNNVYGFGRDRIERLEDEMQRLYDTEVKGADPVVLMAGLEKRLKQIRKEA